MFATRRHRPLQLWIKNIDKEVIGQRANVIGQDTQGCLVGRCAQDTHSTDQRRHLWRGQAQKMGFVHQSSFGAIGRLLGHVVSESIGVRFQWGEGVCIRLLGRGVGATRTEWHHHRMSCSGGRGFNCSVAGQNNQVSQRNLNAIISTGVECLSDALQGVQCTRQSFGLIDGP